MSDLVERLSDLRLACISKHPAGASAEDARSMADELSRRRALTEWRFDMENAPKVGDFFVWHPGSKYTRMGYHIGCLYYMGVIGWQVSINATLYAPSDFVGWCPLPPPPVKP